MKQSDSNKPVAAAQPHEGRRGFLKGVAVAGGVAAAVGAGGAAAASGQPTAEPVAATEGYHETPHIRDYYRTARL